MKKMKHLLLILAAVLNIGLFLGAPAFVYADAKSQIKCGVDEASGAAADCSNPPPSTGVDDVIRFVLNLLSTIAGVAAVIMIIISGIKYTTSAGNADKVKSAKNTLLYAAVGLAIVALTQTIVHLVLTEASHPTKLGVLFRL